jgi:hypothetical protein
MNIFFTFYFISMVQWILSHYISLGNPFTSLKATGSHLLTKVSVPAALVGTMMMSSPDSFGQKNQKNYCYEIENNSVYYNWVKENSLDPQTFQVLGDFYGRDKNWVYYNWVKKNWADPQTFEALGDSYGKDKNYVYFRGDKIWWADLQTFQVIGDFYGKDKNSVYANWVKKDWADPQTFVVPTK